jgi:zeaxanthin glucosyltransferase
VAKHRDVQLILSLGSQIAREQLGSVPDNTIVVQRAPQLEVLKKTAVCITHAGLNTVLESLAQGVPQVAIPIAFDQPGIAARIADKKTGLVTSLDKLTPDHLSDLIGEALSNPSYRQNSGKIQEAIRETDGLRLAAQRIEEALGVYKSARSARPRGQVRGEK